MAQNQLSTIFLGTDGRHVTIGRGADVAVPVATLDGIRAQGLRGWIVTMHGSYHAKRRPTLGMIRPVDGTPQRHWRGAVATFMEARP